MLHHPYLPLAPLDDLSRRLSVKSWTGQPVVVGGPPCPCPPGPVLSGGPGSAEGPLDGGETLVGGADTLGGEPGFCPCASALLPGATSSQ